MAFQVDREVLVGFQEEVRGYLPAIRRRLSELRADPDRLDAIEEVHRIVQSVRGAAAMIGLRALAESAGGAEKRLEAIAGGEIEEGRTAVEAIGSTIAHIEQALLTVLAVSPPPSATFPQAGLAGLDEPFGPASEDEKPADDEPDRFVSEDLREAFEAEAEELLGIVADRLRGLEQDPSRRELVQDVRRAVHTVKGAAGVAGLRMAGRVAHRMEDLLDRLYEGAEELDPPTLELLQGAADLLDDLSHLRLPHETARERVAALMGAFDERLHASPGADGLSALAGAVAGASSASADAAPQSEAGADGASSDNPEPQADSARRAGGLYARVPLERVEEMVRLASELIVNRSAIERHYERYLHEIGELRLSLDRLRRLSGRLETDYASGFTAAATPWDAAGRPANGGSPSRAVSGTAAEFDELEFDRYSDFYLLARDLSETSADLLSGGGQLDSLAADLYQALTRMGRLTSDFQERLMRLRMGPLAQLNVRLHRTVRVTAQSSGRRARLTIHGAEIEIDRLMLEELGGSLEHLLRNAVDHGIEPPERRRELGKPEEGRIELRAWLEGAQAVFELTDDGRGLDPERLRARAVERGVLTERAASELSDRDAFLLIFETGFSTADEISQTSGRGVGLDAVRAAVAALNGSIAVDSEPGRGAAFFIRLPTTLAVMRVLSVEAGGRVFAVPQHSVVQVLRIDPERVEIADGEPTLRHEDENLPLVSLAESLGLTRLTEESDRSPALIVRGVERRFALVVDRIADAREVVVKSLGGLLRRVHGVSGATIVGDGSVVLILNPAQLDARASAETWRAPLPRPDVEPRILVVDDSLSVRRVVANLLETHGWQVTVAKDGVEALELLRASAEPPSAMLVDVEMPRMDGFELTATLRGSAEYADLPVVMLTSRSGEKHRAKAAEAGATDYVVKPFQQEALLATLERVALEAGAPAP